MMTAVRSVFPNEDFAFFTEPFSRQTLELIQLITRQRESFRASIKRHHFSIANPMVCSKEVDVHG